MTEPTRALSLHEQRLIENRKRGRATAIKWTVGTLAVVTFVCLLVRYCTAEVGNVDAYLTGRAIQENARYRSLRLGNDIGIKAAAESDAAAGDSSSVSVKQGTSGGPTTATTLTSLSRFSASRNRGGAGADPAALNLANPPASHPRRGDSPPSPRPLSSGELWSQDNYCDTDSDILARRDLLTEHFESYGNSTETAAWVSDVCIEFAQLTGAELWYTAATVTAESGGNPKARNRSSGCSGLFQLHPCHRKRMAKMGLDYDLEDDRITFARTLYLDQGWKPWAPSKRNAQRIARKLEQRWNKRDRE